LILQQFDLLSTKIKSIPDANIYYTTSKNKTQIITSLISIQTTNVDVQLNGEQQNKKK